MFSFIGNTDFHQILADILLLILVDVQYSQSEWTEKSIYLNEV